MSLSRFCLPRLSRPALGGLLFAVSLALLMPLWATANTNTEFTRPLLMEGKRSLYQRVLSRPMVKLASEAGAALSQDTDAFSIFYVYQRADVEGVSWVKVGSNTRGKISGWLPEKDVISWNQALTVAFREPLGHDRVLLFKNRSALKSLVDIYDIGTYRKIYSQALKGEVGEKHPVVAIQPKAHVDIHDDFYLVPIKQHEDVFLENEQVLLLNVASVPLENNEATPSQTAQGETPNAVTQRAFKSGLVFVVDTTTSMGPYIDRTREVVKNVYDAIDHAGLDDEFSFGLVGYRDTLELRPGLEYVTRTFAGLKEGRDPKDFFDKVEAVAPATVSSRGFIEDAFSGVKSAIEDIDWKGYDGRYIVLVSDAGPREGADPLSATGLSPEGLRQLAQDQGVSIWVMHLRTPQGVGNHVSAEKSYRALSYYPSIGDFYYGVETGDVEKFGLALSRLSGDLTRQVADAARDMPPVAVPDERPGQSELRKFRTRVAKLGNALRLRYLAEQAGQKAPDIFDAWMLDHYFTEPENQSVDVRLLLTRDQLSDLTAVLKQVLETAEEGLLAPQTFLEELKSLAASMSRDPASVASSTRATAGNASNLADLGYMREYIEGLPYTGEVMNVSLEDWENWSAKQQLAFINNLEDKISYYKALHDHTDLWISLDGGPVSGDSVFPVVLSLLP